MKRGYRGLGRERLSGASYDQLVGGEMNYLDYGSPLRESFSGSSDYDREILHSLMQQRALEEQLSFRDSQLAMANSLLLKQQKQHHQQHQVFNKRRMDETPPRGGGDFRMDFKRPRLVDNRSQPKNRSTGQGPNARGRARGARRSSRNQRNRGHGQGSADKSNGPKETYVQERATVVSGPLENRKKRVWCSLCSVDFQDREELEQHKTSGQHKGKVASYRISNPPKNMHNKVQQPRLSNKQKDEVMTKGCSLCHITSFRGFKDVLAHLDSKKHMKNLSLDKDEKAGTDLKSKPVSTDSLGKKRERIKVELPPELSKFDPKVVVGQGSVIAVTGWFCKLCNKFYNNEVVAKETHCMTEPHFNNYKNFMYAKLKAEAVREAQKKRAEEEQKMGEGEVAAAATAEKEGDDKDATTTTIAATTTTAELSTEQMEDDNQEPSEGGEPREEEDEMEVGESKEEEEEDEAGANDADVEEETGAEGEGGVEEETGVEGELAAGAEGGAEEDQDE